MSEQTILVVNAPEPEPETVPEIHVEVIVPESAPEEIVETHCEHCASHEGRIAELQGEINELRNTPPVVIETPVPEIEPEPEPEHHEPDSAPRREHPWFSDHPLGGN